MVIKNKKYIKSDSVGYLIPKNRALEIDSESDWEYAEFLMGKVDDR